MIVKLHTYYLHKMKNSYLDSNIIFENKFSIEIMKLATDIIKKEKLDVKEYFIMTILKYFIEINEKFNDLNYAYLHINNYPSNKDYRKIFPTHKYLSYHTEIYIIKVVSLFDRILHLINSLYDLKINLRYLTLNNVKKTKKVNKNILNILETFYNETFELRTLQNTIKHELSLEIEELAKANLYEFILNHSKDLDEDRKNVMKLFINMEFKKYKRTHKLKLRENTIHIAKFINNILDGLYPVFKKELEK